MPKRNPKTFVGEQGESWAGPVDHWRCSLCQDMFATDVGIRHHFVRKHGVLKHTNGSLTGLSAAELSEFTYQTSTNEFPPACFASVM